MRKLYYCSVFSGFLLLAGCFETAPQKDDFSGFISDYSGLQQQELPSGTVILHWRNQSLKDRKYTKLMIEPTVFYPEPKVNDNVSAEILQKIKVHVDRRLKKLAEKNHIQLTNTPGKDVLRLRHAFTAMRIEGEAFTLRNLLPVQLVLTAAELAVGGRDQDVTIVHEFEVVDSISNESMVKGIRKGNALQLSNNREKLTMEHIEPLLEKWGIDIEQGFNRFAKFVSNKR